MARRSQSAAAAPTAPDRLSDELGDPEAFAALRAGTLHSPLVGNDPKPRSRRSKSSLDLDEIDRSLSGTQTGTGARADEPAAFWVPTSSLVPWDKNPRRNDENVSRVAASIKRFGFGAPIVARTHDRTIIAGHTRWKAALEIGLDQVPVRFVDLDPAEAQLLALADNRLNELSPWDTAQLQQLLSEHSLPDVELAGWSGTDLEAMASDILRDGPDFTETEDEELPELTQESVSKPGDVWTLGRHRLICGDGTRVGGMFGMVVTDPPYGLNIVNKNGHVGGTGIRQIKGRFPSIAGDDSVPDIRWLLDTAEIAVIWGGNHFADQLPASPAWLIWDKRVDTGAENNFADCEMAWSNRSGPARIHRQLWLGMIREGETEKRIHPTQKPVALMQWCLSFGQGLVFDPYAGSGSTLIACEKAGRDCTAVELSPQYCDGIIQRWERLTGGKAVLSS
jgi:DNA modification methylase